MFSTSRDVPGVQAGDDPARGLRVVPAGLVQRALVRRGSTQVVWKLFPDAHGYNWHLDITTYCQSRVDGEVIYLINEFRKKC